MGVALLVGRSFWAFVCSEWEGRGGGVGIGWGACMAFTWWMRKGGISFNCTALREWGDVQLKTHMWCSRLLRIITVQYRSLEPKKREVLVFLFRFGPVREKKTYGSEDTLPLNQRPFYNP